MPGSQTGHGGGSEIQALSTLGLPVTPSISTEDFLKMSLPEGIAFLERQQEISVTGPSRRWLTAMAASITTDQHNPIAERIQSELDEVAHMLHSHMQDNPAHHGAILPVAYHLNQRVAEELKVYEEVARKYRERHSVFKELGQFEAIFEEYYRKARGIAERAARKRKVSSAAEGEGLQWEASEGSQQGEDANIDVGEMSS